MTRFADHFSRHAEQYAAHRPDYPPEVFAFLASLCSRHDLAWDCGTGSGQAAVGLAAHFTQVWATDPSEAQLTHARPHPRVVYRQTAEAASGLPSASVDLVAAAQAFHWFDGAAFFAEARRVARPDAVVAVWCYGMPVVGGPADAVLREFHDVTVGADWPPPGRELVNTLYRTIPFPPAEIAAPAFRIERQMDLPALGRYVTTWSAVQRHRARTGRDPMPALMANLAAGWGDERTERTVTWPIGLRVGRLAAERPC